MAQPAQFVTDLVANAKLLVYAMDQLAMLKARYDEDNTLVSGYAATPGARTDITATDLTNVLTAAFVQMNLTFTTGSPTQKSLFDKLL